MSSTLESKKLETLLIEFEDAVRTHQEERRSGLREYAAAAKEDLDKARERVRKLFKLTSKVKR